MSIYYPKSKVIPVVKLCQDNHAVMCGKWNPWVCPDAHSHLWEWSYPFLMDSFKAFSWTPFHSPFMGKSSHICLCGRVAFVEELQFPWLNSSATGIEMDIRYVKDKSLGGEVSQKSEKKGKAGCVNHWLPWPKHVWKTFPDTSGIFFGCLPWHVTNRSRIEAKLMINHIGSVCICMCMYVCLVICLRAQIRTH